jgi:hypothetical protein
VRGGEGLVLVDPLAVEAPVMKVVEDQGDAGALVDPEHLGDTVAGVVVLENQPAADMLGQQLPCADPALAAGREVAVDAADVGDNHSLRAELHEVEEGGLGREVGRALRDKSRVGAVKQDVL